MFSFSSRRNFLFLGVRLLFDNCDDWILLDPLKLNRSLLQLFIMVINKGVWRGGGGMKDALVAKRL